MKDQRDNAHASASETPTVSVVMAVYNRIDDIAGALRSVREQTYPAVELVVIDGDSTDGTADMLRDSRSEIDHLVIEPDDGIYDAWNKGLHRATGDWVLFLGSDDRYASPEAIATLMRAAARAPEANLIVGRAALLHADGTIGARIGTRWGRRRIELCMTVAHPAVATSRALIDRYGPFSTTLGVAADYDLYLRARHDVRACDVDDVIVHFSDGGISSSNRRATLRSARDVQAQPAGVGSARAAIQFAGFHIALPIREQMRALRGRSSRRA